MNSSNDTSEASWIPWLADAPLFIDQQQVGVFYDAVLRPAFRTVQVEVGRDRTEELEKRFGANIGAKLPIWFPWLGGEVGIEGELAKTSTKSDSETVTLEPIESPGRQLVELSLHYLEKQRHRIWFPERDWALPDEARIVESPRLLGFFDFPPKTKFMPMAAELNDGRVVTFFGPLVDKLKQDGGTLPVQYPDDPADPAFEESRDEYWRWFSDYWSANKAIQVIENVIGTGGRPRWIDYRVPISGGSQTIHLHVVGRGEFDTGVFAYNLVKRGWKHGLRVVGTLKSEPDVNVLAIYEK